MGGLAALPLLQSEALTRGWFTSSEFFHMVAVSESTPGPIGINMATYVGLEQGGLLGALAATLGMVTPSLIIIVIVARFFLHFNERPMAQSIMAGLRPAVTGLIATAAFQVLLVAVIPWQTFRQSGRVMDLLAPVNLVMFLGLGWAYLRWKGHPIFYIAVAAVAGMLLL